MTAPLPAAIRQFVDTTNAGDTAGFLDSFTQTGVLTDWGRTYTGRAGIAHWNDTDNIGVAAHMRVVSIEEKQGIHHARVAVTGQGFNGEGRMAFTLEGDRIARLVIS